MLDKMVAEWQPVMFEILPYKDTGTFILKGNISLKQYSLPKEIQIN